MLDKLDLSALAGRAVRNVQIRILLIRVVSVVASFLVITMLARFAGPATVGEYGFAIVTATTLGYICMLGLEQLVLRSVPADLLAGNTGRARLTVSAFATRIGIASMLVAALFLLAFPLLPSVELRNYRAVYQATAALVLVYPLLRFCHSLLRAIGMPVRAQIVESLSATSMALLIGGALLIGITPSSQLAVYGFVAISVTLLMLAAWLYRRAARPWGNASTTSGIPPLNAGVSFMLITLVHASTEWFALYALLAGSDARELGVFRAVFQVAALLTLVVQTGQTYVAPLIAGDLSTNNRAQALRRYRQSRRIMLLLAIIPTGLLLAAPEQFLVLAFGPQFRGGALALSVLVLGQFINVATGPVGAVLAMAGRERVLLNIALIAMVLVVALSLILVPIIGLTGTAVALAVSTILRNLATYWFARQVLHDHPDTALPEPHPSVPSMPPKTPQLAMMAIGSPHDPRTWSGTPFFVLRQLEAHFPVDVIETPRTDYLVNNTATVMRRFGWDVLREGAVHQLYAQVAGRRVQRSRPDLLFGVICSHKMIDLAPDVPLILMADALFASISSYYSNRTRPLARTQRLGNRLQQRMMDRASAIMLTSDWAAEDARAHYRVPHNTRIIVAPIGPNMMDDPGLDAVSSGAGLARPPRLLFVGFDWLRKGGPDVLRLHAMLRAHIPGLGLDIVGCHPPEAEGLADVRIHGRLSKSNPAEYAQLKALYASATLFVMLSQQEAYGIVYAEAASYGLPVIALKTGGVSTLVEDGDNGFLFPVDVTVEAVAARLIPFLTDPIAYQAMRTRSRTRFETRLNWNSWGETAADTIRQAIADWPAKAAWLRAQGL